MERGTEYAENATESGLPSDTLSEREFRDEVERWNGSIDDWDRSAERKCWEIANDMVRAKITSGELMVVKEVEFVSNDYDGNIDCNRCGWSICYIHVEDNPMTFCPGCGAKIVKP